MKQTLLESQRSWQKSIFQQPSLLIIMALSIWHQRCVSWVAQSKRVFGNRPVIPGPHEWENHFVLIHSINIIILSNYKLTRSSFRNNKIFKSYPNANEIRSNFLLHNSVIISDSFFPLLNGIPWNSLTRSVTRQRPLFHSPTHHHAAALSMNIIKTCHDKPVFAVFDQVRLKPACSATEAS